ncbi:efflux RND transporter periplasmic adaptor subunit [Nitrosospira sp. Nsp18]|uniref:efflux RND transporter periplasmic adaptor subunit n=1 Tax=Nitrosospira sp. Nsp18 TaxID=1855334 RepID=UPI0015A3F08A|nr:efflux RND transporter periplasmic adaptor subunit [Nitrosospira sp. Nsp18]
MPGRRRAARLTIAALLILLCIAGALHIFGYVGTNSAAPAPKAGAAALELLPRDVAEATVQALQRTIPLTGTIQPLNQTEIRSQQAAEIQEVLVREGEPVEKGQVLARLDTTDLEAKLRDKLGALDVGKAQLALARKNLHANKSLLERNFISQTAFDNLQSSFHIGEATLVSLQAQVEQARKALAHAVIRSPIAGVIAERVAQPGLAVAVNTKLFTVHDLSLMSIEALVPARDIPAVQVGQEARLLIEGFGERVFIGKVDRINPSTEQGSRSIMVHLLIDNTDGQLKGGMFAQGTLGVSSIVSAVVVPQAAVREQGGHASVFCIEAGALTEQRVETGMRDAATDTIEIRSGLSAGARVVVGNLGNLRAGQPVRVMNVPTE